MLHNYIKSDLFRYTGDTGFKSFIKAYYLYPGFRLSFYYRICKSLKGNSMLLYIPFRLIYRHYSFKYGIELPVQTNIGYGLYIGHFGGIIIASRAVIGNNCNIGHGVTIGVKIINGERYFPVVKDNVFIGTGATLVGGIVVGADCAIGSNAVVTKDCPERSVVVGIPGKVVSEKGSGDYVINKWPV